MKDQQNTTDSITVCALYKFTALPDYQSLRKPMHDMLDQYGIRGTVLLAQEGINGTIAGTDAAIQNLIPPEPALSSH